MQVATPLLRCIMLLKEKTQIKAMGESDMRQDKPTLILTLTLNAHAHHDPDPDLTITLMNERKRVFQIANWLLPSKMLLMHQPFVLSFKLFATCRVGLLGFRVIQLPGRC
jgi:hypothetical protein